MPIWWELYLSQADLTASKPADEGQQLEIWDKVSSALPQLTVATFIQSATVRRSHGKRIYSVQLEGLPEAPCREAFERNTYVVRSSAAPDRRAWRYTSFTEYQMHPAQTTTISCDSGTAVVRVPHHRTKPQPVDSEIRRTP